MASLKSYIKALSHRKEEFVAEFQALKYYTKYARFIAKQGSKFP